MHGCVRHHQIFSYTIKKNRFFNFLFCFVTHEQLDSEEERLPDEKYVENLAKTLPQGTDKTPEVLTDALKGLPDKYVKLLYVDDKINIAKTVSFVSSNSDGETT